MWNFKQVKKNKIFLSLIILSQAVTLLSTHGADNGSGYNGPDLSGSAIPIHLDRSFTIEDLHQTYKTCFKREIVDIFTKLFCNTVPESEIQIRLRGHGYPEITVKNNCFQLVNFSEGFGGSSGGGLNWLFSDKTYFGQNIGKINHSLPHFRYDSELKEGAKDMHGRILDRTRIYLKNLRLESYLDNSRVELVRQEEGVSLKADYTINIKAYGDCLRNEIYK